MAGMGVTPTTTLLHRRKNGTFVTRIVKGEVIKTTKYHPN